MKRVERRLFAIGDRLATIEHQRREVLAELAELREIAAESAADAVYHDEALDRADARLTASDVERFERLLDELARERVELESRRAKLMAKME